jgi:AIR synthase-related protein
MSEWSLAAVVEALQTTPAWQRKHELGVLAEGLASHQPLVEGRPVLLGDDTAAIETEDGYLLLATEVIYPPLVKANPYLAGRSAILANINDVYAMGGYPLAVVNTILAETTAGAAEIIRGLRDGCNRYGVGLVGGHLTATGEINSVSACILGQAKRLLSSFRAQPGDAILHVVNLRGEFHPHFPFWDCSAHLSDAELRRDLAILPTIAEAGWCDAARDISMAGILGSLMMLLELSGVGARVDLVAIPQPAAATERYLDWLLGFPSYGFILTARPRYVSEIQTAFATHQISCAVIGEVTPSAQVIVQRGQEEALLRDLVKEPFMGFGAAQKMKDRK